MSPALKRALADALGSEVTGARPVGGGDINDAYAVTLADGREVFVKTHDRADPRMFAREARGLEWLREPDALPVPRILAFSPEDSRPSFLALEMIRPGRRRPDYAEELGRGLATVHRFGAEHFGLDHDNFIGPLPQDNTPSDDWVEFYARRRLEPMVRRAVDEGPAPRSWIDEFEALFSRLGDLVGPDEPPARLHGDLWSGNLHTTADGAPCLIDPAVYGGHREIDLAMLSLFGRPSERFWDAYHEVWPLEPGWRERTPLYQLYPLLVHVNLFGGPYLGSVEHTLRGLV